MISIILVGGLGILRRPCPLGFILMGLSPARHSNGLTHKAPMPLFNLRERRFHCFCGRFYSDDMFT